MKRVKEYYESYVAFIDILGFSSLVKESENDDNLFNKLTDILIQIREDSFNILPSDSPDTDKSYNEFVDSFPKTITFSDCIAIATKQSQLGLEILINRLHLLLSQLLSLNILTRGALVAGKVFCDREIIIGPALLEAYKLESTVSIYPRIIVDDTVYSHARNTQLNRNNEKSYISNYIRLDNDSLYHLDILKLGPTWRFGKDYYEKGKPSEFEWLSKIRGFIVRELMKPKTNLNTYSKIAWMGTYFNDHLNRNPDIEVEPIPLDRISFREVDKIMPRNTGRS